MGTGEGRGIKVGTSTEQGKLQGVWEYIVGTGSKGEGIGMGEQKLEEWRTSGRGDRSRHGKGRPVGSPSPIPTFPATAVGGGGGTNLR